MFVEETVTSPTTDRASVAKKRFTLQGFSNLKSQKGNPSVLEASPMLLSSCMAKICSPFWSQPQALLTYPQHEFRQGTSFPVVDCIRAFEDWYFGMLSFAEFLQPAGKSLTLPMVFSQPGILQYSLRLIHQILELVSVLVGLSPSLII